MELGTDGVRHGASYSAIRKAVVSMSIWSVAEVRRLRLGSLLGKHVRNRSADTQQTQGEYREQQEAKNCRRGVAYMGTHGDLPRPL